jgi:hypothetical protein
MGRFGLCGPSYLSQSPNADAEDCTNWYPERIEQQGKTQYALYSCPGTFGLFRGLGDGPVRAETTTRSSGSGINRTFQVVGSKFYEITANPFAATVRGSGIINDGKRVSICVGQTQILFASGGTAYVYDLTANTLVALNPAVITNVAFVGYSDGFFIALQKNSNQLNTSNPLDATTWPPTNFANVSVFPDNILSMLVDHRELFLWSGSKGILYYDSGNLFPFDPDPSGIIEQGIVAPLSAVKADNSVFWLNGSERGAGMFFRNVGYLPTRISDHGVEQKISKYARIDDCVGYTMEDKGHTFIVWTFPTANATWCYDVTTGFWHQRLFWNQAAARYDAHHSWGHTFNFGKHLLSDPNSGNIYDLSQNYLTDDADLAAPNVIRRQRVAPQISNGREWIFFPAIEIYVETGLGPEPPLLGESLPLIQTTFTLQDPNGNKWDLNILANGLLQTTPNSVRVPQVLTLNDAGNLHTFNIGVNINGQLVQTPLALMPGNQQSLLMVSIGGTNAYLITITAGGVLVNTPTSTILPPQPRDPQLILSWSDDGGHTYSNEYALNCGQIGKFRTRAIKRRLGKSRGRNFKIVATDPIVWNIIDGYIPPAQPRYAERIREVT